VLKSIRLYILGFLLVKVRLFRTYIIFRLIRAACILLENLALSIELL